VVGSSEIDASKEMGNDENKGQNNKNRPNDLADVFGDNYAE